MTDTSWEFLLQPAMVRLTKQIPHRATNA